jgi:hypothetical protein
MRGKRLGAPRWPGGAALRKGSLWWQGSYISFPLKNDKL